MEPAPRPEGTQEDNICQRGGEGRGRRGHDYGTRPLIGTQPSLHSRTNGSREPACDMLSHRAPGTNGLHGGRRRPPTQRQADEEAEAPRAMWATSWAGENCPPLPAPPLGHPDTPALEASEGSKPGSRGVACGGGLVTWTGSVVLGVERRGDSEGDLEG